MNACVISLRQVDSDHDVDRSINHEGYLLTQDRQLPYIRKTSGHGVLQKLVHKTFNRLQPPNWIGNVTRRG
jgi:hypothetical protein